MSKETISQTEGLCKEVANCIRNAYDRGYKQGQKDMEQDTMAVLENGKMIGREEAWECARKLSEMLNAEINQIFNDDIYWVAVFKKYSASEAIAKIKEYEEKQKAVTIQQERDCKHCSKVYGTLGCCTTVSNKWIYSCEEGHKQYAERHKADSNKVTRQSIIKSQLMDIVNGQKNPVTADEIAEVLEQLKGE